MKKNATVFRGNIYKASMANSNFRIYLQLHHHHKLHKYTFYGKIMQLRHGARHDMRLLDFAFIVPSNASIYCFLNGCFLTVLKKNAWKKISPWKLHHNIQFCKISSVRQNALICTYIFGVVWHKTVMTLTVIYWDTYTPTTSTMFTKKSLKLGQSIRKLSLFEAILDRQAYH